MLHSCSESFIKIQKMKRNLRVVLRVLSIYICFNIILKILRNSPKLCEKLESSNSCSFSRPIAAISVVAKMCVEQQSVVACIPCRYVKETDMDEVVYVVYFWIWDKSCHVLTHVCVYIHIYLYM